MMMKPEAKETRIGWVVAAIVAVAALAGALGVRTPQQTTDDLRQDVNAIKGTLAQHADKLGAHDVMLATQGQDLKYIKEAVDEIRGHTGTGKNHE